MSEQKILATVDGVNITDAEVDAFIASLPREQQMYAQNPDFREQCFNEVLSLHLYAKMGKEEKLDETEEFAKYMESAKKDILSQLAMRKVLSAVEVTSEECREYYNDHKSRFQREASASAKHILVDTEEKCLEIMEAIKSGEKEFEQAAREFSSCPSGAKGGDLGTFGPGQMVPEFDKVTFEAPIGEVVGPVKTNFGYHIIKVEDRTEAKIAEFEMVESQVRRIVTQQKQADVYAAKFAELREKYLER